MESSLFAKVEKESMSDNEKLKQDIIQKFGTPCAVIDLDIVDRNIAHLQALCDKAKLANRPHIKTHKSPLLALRQLEAGATGITCQKLGEAEVMFRAGITDILIATNIIGAAKSGKLAALLRDVSLQVCADNPISLDAYAEAGRAAGRPVTVVIECDTGQKRAGVVTPNEAVALAKIVQRDPWLEFGGLMFYPPLDGWPVTQEFFDTTQAGLSSLSLAPKIISTGGTPNLKHLGLLDGATEHRSGTSIFLMSTTAVKPRSVKTSMRMAMARGSSKTESSELMYAKPEMECFSTMGMKFDWIKSTT